MSKKKKEQTSAAHRRIGVSYQELAQGKANPYELYFARGEQDKDQRQLNLQNNPMQSTNVPKQGGEGDQKEEHIDLADLRKQPKQAATSGKSGRLKERKIESYHRTSSIKSRKR